MRKLPSALFDIKHFYAQVTITRDSWRNTRKYYIRTGAPQSIAHAQVLYIVTIERNGCVMFFQKQSLPASNEVELPDAFRREVNSAVQKVLEDESVKQWTNLRVTQRTTLLLMLMNSRDIVKLIDLDCACVLPHYLNRHLLQ